MAFEEDHDVCGEDTRGMILTGEMGDLELAWEPHNDDKMRPFIKKKMDEGVQFFITKHTLGNILTTKKKLRRLSELKDCHVTIKDKDIEVLLLARDAALVRSPGNLDTVRRAQTVDDVVQNRTVGFKAFQGG